MGEVPLVVDNRRVSAHGEVVGSQDLRVVVLEDHPLVRDALLAELSRIRGPVEAVYKGADVDAALAALEECGADIVLLDLDLGAGVAPLATLNRLTPLGVPVVIVSALGSPAVVRSCLAAGAVGYVSKQSEQDQLADAVAAALSSTTYTSPEVTAILISDLTAAVKLSPREERAAVLYASGMKLATVARTMGVSNSTAQEYINRVRTKYDAAGRPSRTKTDLYRAVREDGLLP